MMRADEVERYVGIPYCVDTMDCADFVALVQLELFGREVSLPNGRPRGSRGQAALGELSRPFGVPTSTPKDGDFVLMFDRGRLGHVGTYFHLAHEGHVLHSSSRIGCSVIHRVRDLPEWGARIEGYYTWA